MKAPAFDYWATIQPDAGLVRAAQMHRPQPGNNRLWTFALDVGRRERAGERLGVDDYPLDLVGAVGLTRVDAFVRGVGEAVERHALLAPVDACAAYGVTAAYDSTDLGTGAAGPRLPAYLVDYPFAGPADEVARSSPSGAASGVDLDSALSAALRELVERDAVMLAWGRQARLERLPLPTLVSADLGELLDRVREQGLSAQVGTVATAVPGLRAYVGVVLGEAPCSAVGSAVSATAEQGATRALREALQVLTVLRGVRSIHEGEPCVIDGDLARARYWTGASANAALRAWTDGFVDAPPPANCPEPGLRALADAVVADAGPGCWVDLTARLPDAVRAQGWRAVKAVVPGLQPLRMTELAHDEWRTDRLGLTPDQTTAVPHPWI